MQRILVTFYVCSLQISRVRPKLEAEVPGHDQPGRERWDPDLPMSLERLQSLEHEDIVYLLLLTMRHGIIQLVQDVGSLLKP